MGCVSRTEQKREFDDVIFATGFTAALAPLGDLVRTDAKGFAVRTESVISADQPTLYFVGHNYDATGACTTSAVMRAGGRANRPG